MRHEEKWKRDAANILDGQCSMGPNHSVAVLQVEDVTPQIADGCFSCAASGLCWHGGRRHQFNSTGAVRIGWKWGRPIFKPRKGPKPKGMKPAYPHGIPSPPSRGGGPDINNPKKQTPARAAPVDPYDPLAFGRLRRFLLNSPDARYQFFGRVREKVDRFHSIVKL